jgi:3-oxoadipate enol-lactonase
VRANGLPALVGANMERWFTKDFRERAPDVIARMTEMFLKTDIEGYVGCMEAIRDMDHRPLLPKIKAPAGSIRRPRPGNEFIRDHIPGAKLAVRDAAHLANMELPQAYADTVLGFLLN